MCFFISFMPATFLVVIGYFVLFSSTWAVNGVKTFGRSLAIWIFVIAALIPIAGAYVTLAGLCPDLKTLHSTMMPSPTP
jgi:TRAP-type mannitol/chloroaromatic compound transport system permease small subunit